MSTATKKLVSKIYQVSFTPEIVKVPAKIESASVHSMLDSFFIEATRRLLKKLKNNDGNVHSVFGTSLDIEVRKVFGLSVCLRKTSDALAVGAKKTVSVSTPFREEALPEAETYCPVFECLQDATKVFQDDIFHLLTSDSTVYSGLVKTQVNKDFYSVSINLFSRDYKRN